MSKLILPGLIDPHVHLRDPGQTYKEDFYTGTCAALAGGFTTILDMPNNKVPITTAERLNEKIKIARGKIVCDVGFHFGSLGDNLDEFEKVKNKVMGLKLYLNQTTGNFLIGEDVLRSIFNAWQKTSITPSLDSNEVLKRSILVHAEDRMLDVVIKLVKKLGNRVHVCHISSAYDLKQIIRAKNDGLPITCGVAPHYLFLTDILVKKIGHYALIKPFIKTKEDQEFLWKNLKWIDAIESDHAPHNKEDKAQAVPPTGFPGLETTLPLLLTAVSEKKITIKEIKRLCHDGPAKIFNIKTSPKTYIEIDPNESWTIDQEKMFTKCKMSPFNGWKVKGKVERVFIRGQKVFENGKILVKPGYGKILT